MSDLDDALQHMAADGANKARPLNITEVLRRGDRRRARILAQRSLSGLSVLGVAAAVVVGGALPFQGSASHPASRTAGGETTLAETVVSSAGTLTIHAKYRVLAHGRIKPVSIHFAGLSKQVNQSALMLVAFRPIVLGPVIGPQCPATDAPGLALNLKENKDGTFARSLSPSSIARVGRGWGECGNEAMTVSVIGSNSSVSVLMTATVIFSAPLPTMEGDVARRS